MDEQVSVPDAMIETGLMDLSGLSLGDVLDTAGSSLEGTVLGYALQRIVRDAEDPIAEFRSALITRTS